jgi:hypothetical protein
MKNAAAASAAACPPMSQAGAPTPAVSAKPATIKTAAYRFALRGIAPCLFHASIGGPRLGCVRSQS